MVLRQLPLAPLGILLRDECAVCGTLRIVVAGHEELLHPVAVGGQILGEYLVPDARVEAHLLNLAAMREVSAMDDRVDILLSKVAKRGGEVLVGPVVPRTPAGTVYRPQVRVADDAEHDVRVLRGRPTRRRGEQASAAKRTHAHRRENAPYES